MKTYIIVGIILVVISFVCIFLSLIRKNDSFFNIRKVVKNHLRLFKDCPYQYVVFYVLPLFFSVGLSLIYQAAPAFYSDVSVIIGILLSILLAMLSIISGYDFAEIEDVKQKENANRVLSETVNAIIFACLLCVFVMLFVLAMIVIEGVDFSWLCFNPIVLKCIASGVVYYVFSVILLSLLLIVKHVSNILECKRSYKK